LVYRLGNETVPVGVIDNNQSRFQPRPENLALLFQEVLTAIARLRTNRQSVSDARAFRVQIKENLRLADSEARKRGYSQESIRLATFAVVAFVDESVMNQRTEIFEDWARKPLQEELFGVALAGNIFFENVQRLLVQNDSAEVADLLELHQLCLLLGYRGRYGAGAPGELRIVIDAITDKIRRIRGSTAELSPAWKLPQQERLPSHSDPWARRLLLVFGACLVVTLSLFLLFSLALDSRLSALRSFASETRR
jgi:type VI secretion system protein ImpK